MKKISEIFHYLIFILLIFLAVVFLVSKVNFFGGIKFFIVESGSMEPSIRLGSVIAVKPEKIYKVRDVITVAKPENKKVTLTHRIVKIEKKDKQILYVTKGDANKSNDSELRKKENVIGKVIFTIPIVGYIVNFAKSKEGLFFLIIIPSIIIIYTELLNIKREIVALRVQSKKNNNKIKKKKK